jgi:hypothetical protein
MRSGSYCVNQIADGTLPIRLAIAGSRGFEGVVRVPVRHGGVQVQIEARVGRERAAA